MDLFKSLTGGGARFDRKRFASDINSFEPQKGKASTVASGSTLPTELDFFGTEVGVTGVISDKAKAKKDKKRKRAEESAAIALATGIDYPLLLRQQRIKYTGLEPPNPITSIPELVTRLEDTVECVGLLRENWEKMGLKKPTAIQMAAWGVMLEKRDLLACAPTGSGKTLAFLLPLLILHPPSASTSFSLIPKPRALILEPTRELAMQVWRESLKLSEGGQWKIAVLGEEERAGKVPKKSEGKRKWKKKVKKVEATAVAVEEVEDDSEEEVEVEAGEEEETKGEEAPLAGTDILITTPLRLIYAIKAGTIDVSDVRHLILDEADKLFELNFVEQTDDIIAACSNPDLRKAMLSATMPSGVEEMAKSVMSGGGVGLIRVIIGHKDAATETIAQSLHFVGEEDHKLLSLRALIAAGSFTPPVLIFVQSILRAKELATELLFDGINADCIHADRTIEERDEVVRGFAEGRIWCLISTDVLGRGVDFKGVKLVVNYDFPQSGGAYIHRIGRTGRAGKEGKAITFFTKADAPHLKSIVNVMRSSGCEVQQWMLDLKNPSQDLKKKLNLKPLDRKDVRQTNGAGNGKKLDKKELPKRKRVMGGPDPNPKRVKVKGAEKNVVLDE